jgi:predicted lipase
MKILKTDYTSYPYWNAQVHSGWLEAEQNVYEDVRNEVLRLKGLFPGYQVRTTGHSLGAALALLTQLDLLKEGIYTTMINFG